MKKILAVLAAAAVALLLVGCPNFGDVETSGDKWEENFKIDATGELKDGDGNALTGDSQYARGFVALSASKSCTEIETTITLEPDEDIKRVLNYLRSKK